MWGCVEPGEGGGLYWMRVRTDDEGWGRALEVLATELIDVTVPDEGGGGGCSNGRDPGGFKYTSVEQAHVNAHPLMPPPHRLHISMD